MMNLSQSHRLEHRLEQRLEEPGEFARGGYSPFVECYPIEKYREIAPVKIGLVGTSELTYTDFPGNYDLVDRLGELWQESILNALTKRTWELPLVSPPVINDNSYILDGNHRSASASLHSLKMNAILVENQEDLDNLHKLVDAGVLFWPHGRCSYEELNAKLESVGQDLSYGAYRVELDKMRMREEEEYEEIEEGSRADDTQKEKLLQYLTSTVIHQIRPSFMGRSAFRYEPSSGIYDLSPYLRAMNCNVENISFELNKTYSQIREIAKKSPLVRRDGIFSLDDVAQEVMCLIRIYLEK